MFKALEAYAHLIKLALIGLAVVSVLVFYEGIPFILDGRVDTVRKEAATAETLIWTQKMSVLRAEGEKRRQEDQARIDQAEAEYLSEKRLKESALDNMARARRSSPTKDNIAIPRDLARELNKVGK